MLQRSAEASLRIVIHCYKKGTLPGNRNEKGKIEKIIQI
jgi:hypothetical protein